MMNLNNTNPVNIYDASCDQMFEKLQGNILKGHGRNFTAHIFIEFREGQKKGVKGYLKTFANKITSCKKQLKENIAYKEHNISGSTFFGFYISSLGYSYLEEEVESNFLGRMKDSKIDDIEFCKWESGFRNIIHAMILIADDNLASLKEEESSICEEIEKFAKIRIIENGNVLKNNEGAGIEHFGYADGISQPLFFSEEVENFENKYKNSRINIKPFFPLSQILLKDPFCKDSDAFGSYLVFRKLEQDVKGFKDKEAEMAEKLGWKGDKEEEVGAIIVGRFEDGTPHVLSKKEGIIDNLTNNFNYNHIASGKCPFLNHIRATNERDDENKKMIMARRGIPYGIFSGERRDVGLLFMSFQSNIQAQFEATQIKANNSNDLIIGQKLPKKIDLDCFDKENNEKVDIKSFVTLKGGEYFFAPSISYLKNM
nr:Dyp-type peroxidase domain-containing protein [uncultured Chryseobacterium sp.]